MRNLKLNILMKYLFIVRYFKILRNQKWNRLIQKNLMSSMNYEMQEWLNLRPKLRNQRKRLQKNNNKKCMISLKHQRNPYQINLRIQLNY